jgi:hypothetical protein
MDAKLLARVSGVNHRGQLTTFDRWALSCWSLLRRSSLSARPRLQIKLRQQLVNGQVVMRGEFLIHGLSNRRLRTVLPDKTAGQIARILRWLRNHGLLKKVGGTYRYYLSELGRRLLVAALRVTEHVMLPALQPQLT